ncbi:DUF2934 domain-containing protein [Alphaproteobacteria bacterium KMM 3653]|uniref:DUF2934 domain-containing protein n=1 Tax=Harenicola maris TaxID=2841044 RepID=A0AAP2G3Q7_9RHOB|nr:DUF2934 domain-containing protein [Harenicola maris]
MPKAPITPTFTDSNISEAAYHIWLSEGQPDGRDEAHWQQAIEQLKSAKPATKPRKAAAKKPAVKAAAKTPAAKKPAAKKPAAKKAAAK